MRGLFIKDLMLMKIQWRSLCIVAVIALIMGISMNDSIFVMGYITFIVPSFSLSTISYDDFDNGNAFLFTLPITRRDYVVEKYIFTLALSCCTLIIGIIITVLIGLTSDASIILETLTAIPIILSIMAVVLSIMLPLQLKFGAEKARIVVIIIGGIVFVIGRLLARAIEAALLSSAPMFSWLYELNPAVIYILIVVIAASALLASAKISVSVINKKDF